MYFGVSACTGDFHRYLACTVDSFGCKGCTGCSVMIHNRFHDSTAGTSEHRDYNIELLLVGMPKQQALAVQSKRLSGS